MHRLFIPTHRRPDGMIKSFGITTSLCLIRPIVVLT
jgi:hypothetical protein